MGISHPFPAQVCAFLGGVVAPRARVLYLTSRPVALAASTRAFLASLRQGRDGLPDGPLVTSGEGLLGAVYAEVVAKTPDVFKTRALLDVAAAFGGDPGASPVVVGFGLCGNQPASCPTKLRNSPARSYRRRFG